MPFKEPWNPGSAWSAGRRARTYNSRDWHGRVNRTAFQPWGTHGWARLTRKGADLRVVRVRSGFE
jgi:hypothetical protein